MIWSPVFVGVDHEPLDALASAEAAPIEGPDGGWVPLEVGGRELGEQAIDITAVVGINHSLGNVHFVSRHLHASIAQPPAHAAASGVGAYERGIRSSGNSIKMVDNAQGRQRPGHSSYEGCSVWTVLRRRNDADRRQRRRQPVAYALLRAAERRRRPTLANRTSAFFAFGSLPEVIAVRWSRGDRLRASPGFDTSFGLAYDHATGVFAPWACTSGDRRR
jgi:hypothetical protein